MDNISPSWKIYFESMFKTQIFNTKEIIPTVSDIRREKINIETLSTSNIPQENNKKINIETLVTHDMIVDIINDNSIHKEVIKTFKQFPILYEKCGHIVNASREKFRHAAYDLSYHDDYICMNLYEEIVKTMKLNLDRRSSDFFCPYVYHNTMEIFGYNNYRYVSLMPLAYLDVEYRLETLLRTHVLEGFIYKKWVNTNAELTKQINFQLHNHINNRITRLINKQNSAYIFERTCSCVGDKY